MYHIVKSKSKLQPFQVVLLGSNGEVLSSSELLKTKQAAFKNVVAQLNVLDRMFCYVQDDTLKTPLVFNVNRMGKKVATDDMPVMKLYVAGKNKKDK